MQQVFDPYRMMDRTGEMVSAIGNKVAGIASNFFQNNAAWQKMKASSKSDLEAKAKYFTSAIKLLEEGGIDPKKYNIPNFQDERITPEDYAKQLAESIQDAFVGQGAKLGPSAASQIGISNQPGIKDAMGRQGFLDQYSPMGQIDLNGNGGSQVQSSGDFSMANGSDFVGPLQNPPPPRIVPEESQVYDPLAQELIKQVRAGQVSAEKAFERIGKIEEDKNKLKLEKAKEEREEKKRKHEIWMQGVIGASDTNEIVTKDKQPLSANNIDDAAIGARLPYQGAGGSGWGSGGKPNELKLQDAVIKRLQTSSKSTDWYEEKIIDGQGNERVVYKPKPGTEAFRILNDTNEYKRYVTTYFPQYSLWVGIEKPPASKGTGY